MAGYSQWWEAFAGGEFGEDADWGPVTPDTDDYLARTQAFYEEVVGPSFGYEGEAFADPFSQYTAFFDVETMEKAEEAFRMSMGDVYGGATAFAALGLSDPLAWEAVSRYTPETAQQYLEEMVFPYSSYLGGTVGAAYGTSMAKGEEAYTTGVAGEREKLTYGGLIGSQGIASGTSGAVLRSGEGITQAEDVLSEAYKEARTLGAEKMEGMKTTEQSLKDNLNSALTTYLNAIDSEKERWYNNIMADVVRAESTYGIEATGETVSFGEQIEGEWSTGIPYIEGTWEAMQNLGFYSFDIPGILEERGAEACGVGELWNPSTNSCELYDEMALTYEEYGSYCPGIIDECGVCDGPGIPPGYAACPGTGSGSVPQGTPCGPDDCPGPCQYCDSGFCLNSLYVPGCSEWQEYQASDEWDAFCEAYPNIEGC